MRLYSDYKGNSSKGNIELLVDINLFINTLIIDYSE